MWKGYVCPLGTPTNEFQSPGQRNDVDHCLGRCPNPCVTPVLLASMYQAERKNPHQGTYLSASMLAGDGCARQTWYERQPDIDFYELPTRRFWPFRGTIVHGLVEDAGTRARRHGWLSELQMSVPVEFPDEPAPIFDSIIDNGYPTWRFTGEFDRTRPLVITVRGTTDAYNPLLRAIDDLKTTGDLKFKEFLRGKQGGQYSDQIKDSWVLQVNIYRWLVCRTRIPDPIRAQFAEWGTPLPDSEFFPEPTQLAIQLISLMELARTGTGFVAKGKHDTPMMLSKVPVLPMEDVTTFIRARALQWYRWLVLGVRPPVVSADKHFMCRNCPFNGEIHSGSPCFPTEERNAANL